MSETTQDGQPLTNRWMHENTYSLDVRNNMGRSTINKQLDAREHALARCRKQHGRVSLWQTAGCTRTRTIWMSETTWDGQPLTSSWMHGNTHPLENNTGTVSLWKTTGCTRTRTGWMSETTWDGQPLANRWMHENTHKLDVGNNMGRSAINKQLDAREHALAGCRK